MSKEKETCNFPYWKPTNQLPFPAVKGMLLVTNSDFDLPARPDLLIWKTIESVIGVADIALTINEEGTVYTLYKKVNNEVIEVGKIGAVSEENADKLNKITYVSYDLIVNDETHDIKFIGIDKDGGIYELKIYNYVSYNEYTENIANINNRLDTLDTITDTLNDRLITLATDLTALSDDFTIVKNNVNNIILPIVNILRSATNPGLVLAKASDGVNLEWVNKIALDDVTAEVDNQNQTITFYKFLNGIKSNIITIDKITLEQINSIINKLEPIDNTLNAYSTENFILSKINNTDYDWKNPLDIVYSELLAGDNITIEKVNNKIVISSTGGGGGDVTKAYVDAQDNLIKGDLQTETTRATTRENELDNTKLNKTDFNDYLFNGLTAGDGISIERDTSTRNDTRKVKITATGGGGDVTKAYVDAQDNLIKSDLQAEVTRATTRENELETIITNEATRATTRENELETTITNEVTRATTRENELNTTISNEVTRATTRENELATELENKIGYSNVVTMTYAEYQALETKDPNKFYMINDL